MGYAARYHKADSQFEKTTFDNANKNPKISCDHATTARHERCRVTWITNHFGHSRDVHFAWYRKEESTVELTKMAKLLVAVDEGKKDCFRYL